VPEESLKSFVTENIDKVTHLYESITVSVTIKKRSYDTCHNLPFFGLQKANANQVIFIQPLHGRVQHYTKSAQKKYVAKSLNPDHVMIDKDLYLIGGFIVFKSAQIIEHAKDKNVSYIPILKKCVESNIFVVGLQLIPIFRFAQKAEQPETREMCRMCVGDAEDAAEFVPVDEIRSALERGISMTSMSEQESESLAASPRDRSESEVGIKPSTSASSILIQNAAFLTKNPSNYERLVDWLRAEIPNHKFFMVVVFRGSWCSFCSVSIPP